MWTTRQDRTLRVWFQAVSNAGRLRQGLVNGDFTVTIITFDDAASIVTAVSESVQRPGNYFFDVPASFMQAHGPGDYNVSIEIDNSLGSNLAPHIRSAQAGVLQVSANDFDTVSGSVWNAVSSLYDLSGTMGSLLHSATHAQITGTFMVDPDPIVSGVWNANAVTFDTSGTMGFLQNMTSIVSSTVDLIKQVEIGTWQITGSQIVFFTSGTLVELARFNLADISGNPIDPSTQSPFQRNRI